MKAASGRTAAVSQRDRALSRWLAAAGLSAMVAAGLPGVPASATTVPTITTVAGTGNCFPVTVDPLPVYQQYLPPVVDPGDPWATERPADPEAVYGCWNSGGDNVPATNNPPYPNPADPKADPNSGRALLNFPNSPVFDPAGNMYFADRRNHLVRRVTPGADGVVDGDADEIISTVVGSLTTTPGVPLPGAIGSDAGDTKTPKEGNADGHRTTTAKLFAPTSLAVDLNSAGNLQGLVIADQANHKVRYVNLTANAVTVYGVSVATNEVKTIAGSGTATVYGSDGDPATSVKLRSPSGVALDATGNLYIADLGNRTVRKVLKEDVGTDAAGDFFTVAGTAMTAGFSGDAGSATSATLRGPVGVTVSGSRLFVADQGNQNVRLVNLSTSTSVTANNVTVAAGQIKTVAGCSSACDELDRGFSGDGAAATSAQLDFPFSTAFDSTAGDLYISDDNNARVRRVNSSGNISTYAGGGKTCAEALDVPLPQVPLPPPTTSVPQPEAPSDPSSCVDDGNPYNHDGTYNGDNIPANQAQLSNPRGVALHGGSLYVADAGNDRIRRVSPL